MYLDFDEQCEYYFILLLVLQKRVKKSGGYVVEWFKQTKFENQSIEEVGDREPNDVQRCSENEGLGVKWVRSYMQN